jgi:hypothetical protein
MDAHGVTISKFIGTILDSVVSSIWTFMQYANVTLLSFFKLAVYHILYNCTLMIFYYYGVVDGFALCPIGSVVSSHIVCGWLLLCKDDVRSDICGVIVVLFCYRDSQISTQSSLAHCSIISYFVQLLLLKCV